MDNKITVLGFTDSGKTTYLTGMYISMIIGKNNFSLIAQDSNMDLHLERMWDQICEGKKPDPSDKVEIFTFHLAHNYTPVCDFEWVDYPGGLLLEPDKDEWQQFVNTIKESDCLLFLIDGAILKDIQEDDADKYQEQLYERLRFNKGLRSQARMFSRLSNERVSLPPVGIVMTKCDLIPKKYEDDKEHIKAIVEALKMCLAPLYDDSKRAVVQISVSLGGEIEEGFKPSPHNIEQPIAFAVMSILLKYIKAAQLKKKDNKKYIDNHSGLFRSWINAEKINEAQKNIDKLRESIDKLYDDAYSLMEIFPENKTIFVEGVEKNLRSYYRDTFAELDASK